MDRSLFDDDLITPERLHQAASSLSERDWANFCFDSGMKEIRTGTARRWVPRLTLIAALKLGRAADVLPAYEQYLLALDSIVKDDWHRSVSEQGLHGNLLTQSGRLAQPLEQFNVEFQRIVQALGPPEEGVVADIGCGGGLWTLNLARSGYRVLGTERYDFLVDAARRNALHQQLEEAVEFVLDDICDSQLPDAMCSRALCINVTPTLPSDAAFDTLTAHLARITGSSEAQSPRRVILGTNRWGPSRMAAIAGVLAEAQKERQNASRRFANAHRRLSLLEASWWMHPRHIDRLRQQFPSIEVIGESTDAIDGTRVDLLLH